jgi:hypothetical protein
MPRGNHLWNEGSHHPLHRTPPGALS